MPKLSFIIAAWNEQATLELLVERLLELPLPGNLEKEIVIVNDSSKDKTPQIVDALAKNYPEVKGLHNEANLGKSQSVRKGIIASSGDLLIIQDADLEYDPQDIVTMINKLQAENLDVAYGNRFGKKNKVIYWHNYYGNKALSAFSNLFTFPRLRVWIPDMEVCYKLMPGDIARKVGSTIESKSKFGLEPEITAKLSKYKKTDGSHLRFGIVPVSYFPRSMEEGKKMHAFRDGTKALREIVRYNLGN